MNMLYLLYFIFLYLFSLKYFKEALFLILAILPAYLWKIKLFNLLPSNLLELSFLSVLGAILTLLLIRKDLQSIFKQKFTTLILNNKHVFILIFLFVFFSAVNIFFSVNYFKALGLWRAYVLEPILFFILLLVFWDIKDFKKSIYYFIPINILIIVISIIQYIYKLGWWEFNGQNYNFRLESIYPYPNALSLFLLPIVILFFYLFIKFWRNKQYLCFICILFLIITDIFLIVLAQSDGAIVTLALLFMIFLLMYYRLLFIIFSFLGFLIVYLKNYWNKILFQDFSGQIRLNMYKESLKMLKDRFWTGAGIASYQTVMQNYHKKEVELLVNGVKEKHLVEIYLYPHNIFLNFWSEYGFIAGFSFVFFLFYLLYLTWKHFKSNENIIFFFILLSFLIYGLVDVPYFKNDLAMFFWYIVAFIIVRLNLVKHRDHE